MVRFLAGAAACFLMMTAAFLIWQGRAEKRSDLPPAPRLAINQGAAIAAIPDAPEADAKSKKRSGSTGPTRMKTARSRWRSWSSHGASRLPSSTSTMTGG